jgi:hypothetical protein
VSGHLGPLAAALVDEQLEGNDRDRALRHLASCATCRFEVDQQRAVKARLDGLGEPSLPSSLLDRLQSMRPLSPGDAPDPRRVVGPLTAPALPLAAPNALGAPLAAAAPLSPLPLPGGAALVRSATRNRVRRVLVGATSLVLLGGGAAYAAGGSNDGSAAPVRPAVDVYTMQHGTTSGTAPLNDPAVSAVTVGFGR